MTKEKIITAYEALVLILLVVYVSVVGCSTYSASGYIEACVISTATIFSEAMVADLVYLQVVNCIQRKKSNRLIDEVTDEQ